MTESIFWLAVFLVAYPYVIYPVLLRVLARHRRPEVVCQAELPRISLIISAHDEHAVIGAKLANTQALDYPPEKLDIIVVSDASLDGTDEIVHEAEIEDHRIRLLRLNERRGKSAGLNQAVAAARGELVVFSDANALYDRNALRELARCFADPSVGYVVGAAFYSDAGGSRAAENEGLYWRLELSLKRLESDYYSVVGGDGAIYAIRRALFRPLRDDDISDFVNPLQIIAAGFKGRFTDWAFCHEAAGETFAQEFGRKRRIVNRSWRAVRRYARLLSWRRHGRFLFMLISHKVIRWLALPLVAVAWLTGALLIGAGTLYACVWSALTASVCIACWGAVRARRGVPLNRLMSLIFYFYLVNLAAVLGIWDEYRGVHHATWDHVRGSH